MKRVICWPLAWLFYFLGDVVSRLVPNGDGRVAEVLVDCYQWLMHWSVVFDEAGDCGVWRVEP